MVLYEVDSRGSRRESWGGLRDSAVLGSSGRRGAAEVPKPELERIFGIPTPLVGEGPASHAPSPNQSGDFCGPSCWPFEESESERGKRRLLSLRTEEIAAP